MDGWYVQVKGYEGDGGRSILLCGKGYRQHPQLGEQMSAGRHGKTQSDRSQSFLFIYPDRN